MPQSNHYSLDQNKLYLASPSGKEVYEYDITFYGENNLTNRINIIKDQKVKKKGDQGFIMKTL